MKYIKIAVIVFFVLIIIVIILLHLGASYVRTSNNTLQKYFNKATVNVSISKENYKNDSIRVVASGKTDSPVACLFIHGAPGSAGDFKYYIADSLLTEKYFLITSDRLGYGYSRYGIAASLQEQVDHFSSILEKIPQKKVVVISHSYGCAIGGSLAYHNNKVIGHLMMGGLIDPYSEPMHWYSKISYWKATRWIFPKYIKVAGIEKRDHAAQLKSIETEWSNINCPTIMLHDYADWLAPADQNIAFAKGHIRDSLLTVTMREGKSHFIPFNDQAYVIEQIDGLAREHLPQAQE